jgi:peptidoglycan/xylan/chitin deacetylase (PgdA/CDA1 family)
VTIPLLSVLLASGCAARAQWNEAASTRSPSPSVPPAADVTPSATPTPSPVAPTTPPPLTLDQYLARVPSFPPAPDPAPVRFDHPPDMAAWQNRIPTDQKVAFITIDDGLNRHPWAEELIREANVPVTLFLTTNYANRNRGYFATLRDAGRVLIESHTVSHPKLLELSYDDQRYQLCHATDLLEDWYGRRPAFFRPPYGEKNDDTMRAAWSCGLKVGFHWRATVDKGIVYYQARDKKLRPGDIILMHFRPAFPDDFVAALVAIKAAGLTPALLEDYVDIRDRA